MAVVVQYMYRVSNKNLTLDKDTVANKGRFIYKSLKQYIQLTCWQKLELKKWFFAHPVQYNSSRSSNVIET